MDNEKLIEDLRGLLKQYGEKIPYGELVGAPWPYSRSGDLVWQDPEPYFIEQAATALSTLQAENERLKSLLGESGQDLWSKENQRADRLEAENEKLRAELEQARESLDFARTKDAEIVRLGMELDQMKRENETLKHALQNWHEED